jgi:hypothetical protein
MFSVLYSTNNQYKFTPKEKWQAEKTDPSLHIEVENFSTGDLPYRQDNHSIREHETGFVLEQEK